MTSDSELLLRFAEEHAESAFAELVERHIGLVHSAALRKVGGDPHLARDVAQVVFTALARKARNLVRRESLTSWLYTSTHFAACDLVRRERRRRARELEAQAMNDVNESPLQWEQLRPVLDDAMLELADRDREAVLMRFFENLPFAEIGRRLQLHENAARMRVDRALGRLHRALSGRGITSTSAALGVLLANNAVGAVPPDLAAGIVSSSLAAGATAAPAAISEALFGGASVKVALAAFGLLAGVAGLVLEVRYLNTLRAESASLRRAAEAAVAPAASSVTMSAEFDALREQERELRRRIAALQAVVQPGLQSDMVPMTRFANVGQATVGAAFETLFWAWQNVDLPTLEQLIELPPEVRARAATALAQWPDAVRARFPGVTSPERMLALAWATSSAHRGVRMVAIGRSEPDRRVVSAHLQTASGDGSNLGMEFRQSGGGWKWVPAAYQVEWMLQCAGDIAAGRRSGAR